MAIDVYKEWLGIPEGPRPPDHYSLLRLVQFEDDTEKVRKNYKKLNAHVRKYATGQYSNESQKLLNELAKAMLCLTDSEQKMEYDKSQGREIDDRDEMGRRPLTAYLQDEGALTSDQVKEVKSYAERTGLSIRDTVVQLKFVEQDQATRALARELGRPFVDLDEILPDDSVLDMVPRSVVRRFTCLPLFIETGGVRVACSEEPDTELEDEIRLRFGKPLLPALATPLAINQGIAKYYAAGMRQEVAAPAKGSKGAISTASKGASAGTATKKEVSKEPLTAEQKAQRKQIGILAMCWSFIGPILLDSLVLQDMVYRYYPLTKKFGFWLTLFVGLPLVGLFYLTHVKKS